jgi:hypothetical protein
MKQELFGGHGLNSPMLVEDSANLAMMADGVFDEDQDM